MWNSVVRTRLSSSLLLGRISREVDVLARPPPPACAEETGSKGGVSAPSAGSAAGSAQAGERGAQDSGWSWVPGPGSSASAEPQMRKPLDTQGNGDGEPKRLLGAGRQVQGRRQGGVSREPSPRAPAWTLARPARTAAPLKLVAHCSSGTALGRWGGGRWSEAPRPVRSVRHHRDHPKCPEQKGDAAQPWDSVDGGEGTGAPES